MLARVTGGRSGVIEYLVNGMKSDRELSRDELDHRINIDGNINITDSIINGMVQDGREENYLHITLSFGEIDLNEETIVNAYNDYKELVLNAYSSDEFNVYAEIHYPKVKSYQDKKTGDKIERFPHVHMVIPQKNLLSDKSLKPLGLYTSNIKYHDSIQESVNRNNGLESPYDNQRKYRLGDNAEFISRYKGDSFKGSNNQFKNELFELIESKNIRSMDDFKKELSEYGEVSTGKRGAIDEYLQVKLTGSTKNIRLKENAFKVQYIEKRELEREKPSDREVNNNVKEWVNTRSHEVKLIYTAASKTRLEYKNLNEDEKREYLNERRDDFARRYGARATARASNDIQQGRWQEYREPGTTRTQGETFTQITYGLPSLPERGLDATARGRVTEGLLQNNEHHNLERERAGEHNQLRRTDDRSRRGRGINKDLIESFSSQLLKQHNSKNSPETLRQFKIIRKNLEADRVLNHFEKSHGLVKSNYKTFKAKDGSARIKIGKRAFNVSDFSTQHMHQDWQETKTILSDLYAKQLKSEQKKIDTSVIGLRNFNQLQGGLPKVDIFNIKKPKAETKEAREEEYTLNSMESMTRFVTQGTKKRKQSIGSLLNGSVRTLIYLQQQELNGDKKNQLLKNEIINDEDVADQNTISSPPISLSATIDSLMKQQKTGGQYNIKMSDLIAVKNIENNKVEFYDHNTGKLAFLDTGTHIVMADKKPKKEHVAVAMTFAAERFGEVEIKGANEYKQQAIEIAVAKNISVAFSDKKMQEQYMQQRDARNVFEDQSTQVDESKKVNESEGLKVTYNWNAKDMKMDIKINGEPPKDIPDQVIETMRQKDTFLKSYSIEEIQSGKLDLSKTNAQPVPKTFDQTGKPIEAQQVIQPPKQTQ